MFSLTVTMRAGQAVALHYRTEQAAFSAQQRICGATGLFVQEQDAFGRRLAALLADVQTVIIEDMEKAFASMCEAELIKARAQAELQRRAMTDPEIQRTQNTARLMNGGGGLTIHQ